MANWLNSHGALIAVTFAGQSLNHTPSTPTSYPTVMLSTRLNMRRYDVWRDDTGWSTFVASATLMNDLTRSGKAATKSVLAMVGGTNDCSDSTAAATTYANEKTYADAWRTAGGDYVIGTTTTKSLAFGINATVAVGSNGVNTSTFAGAGVLNVSNTANAIASGTVKVATGGTQATITYTGVVAGVSLTGCTTTAGGGVLSTGGTVRDTKYQSLFDLNALVLADANGAFNTVVDLAANATLADMDVANYPDGTHWSATAAAVAASLMGPAVDLLVA